MHDSDFDDGPVDLNRPVLIEHDGRQQLYVFPSIDGGQCTGRTRRKDRCRNEVWDRGQVAGCDWGLIGSSVVDYYGPLSGEVARMYLEQRCRVHDTPEAAVFCTPEWELFDAQRHAHFVHAPSLAQFSQYLIQHRAPPVESFGRAVRAAYDPAERRRLAEILNADEGS